MAYFFIQLCNLHLLPTFYSLVKITLTRSKLYWKSYIKNLWEAGDGGNLVTPTSSLSRTHNLLSLSCRDRHEREREREDDGSKRETEDEASVTALLLVHALSSFSTSATSLSNYDMHSFNWEGESNLSAQKSETAWASKTSDYFQFVPSKSYLPSYYFRLFVLLILRSQ
jgi:hypothetical protein